VNAQPAKFLFGNEFATGERRRPSPSAEREATERAAELAAAEARGYAAGVAAGEQSASARELARFAAAIEQCVGSAMHILGTLDATQRMIEQEAAGLAIEVARRLARGLIEAEPLGEIERVAREALSHVRSAPHLVLRVAPDLVERVQERLKMVAWERGYEGRLIVLGEPDVLTGDCRIDWADGGIVRDSAAISAAVDDIVTRFIAARNMPNGE